MSSLVIYIGIICGYILRIIKKIGRRKKSASNKGLLCYISNLVRKCYFLFCRMVRDILEFFKGIKRNFKSWCTAKKMQLLSNDYIYVFAKVVQIYSNEEYELEKVKICSFKDYCENGGGKYTVIEEGKECPVCQPCFFEKKDSKVQYYISSDIYIAELENVYIKGGSSLILTKDCCLYDPLARDEEGRLDIKFSNLVGKFDEYYLIAKKRVISCIDEGIFLVGFASYNYFHLTVEIMSRLSYIDKFESFRKMPLIVDKVIMEVPQYRALLEQFNIFNHVIITMDSDEMINVKKMIYPSYNTWMPINVKNREMVYPKDFIIAQSALENIRAIKGEISEGRDKKIIISRKNAKNTRLKNEIDVVRLFQKYGFEVVHTEDLSYSEQVELFHKAKCVVGTSGAALTNIVYCQENTDIICIIPEEYKFYMYSTIAYMLNLNPLFLDAKVVERTAYTAADIFELDLDYCERFLKQYVN